MKVFDFENYKDYVTVRIKSMPHGGRGQAQTIAAAIGIHTTVMSQIFRGSKNLSPEQACLLCEHFGLNEFETEYFMALVQLERAGTEKLRSTLRKQIGRLRERSNELAHRLPQDRVLGENEKNTFYSDWYYSGARLLTSIPGHHDVDSIAERLGLPKKIVARVLEFLLATGLCEERDGAIQMGPSRTHIEADSPLISRHHINWRLKALERVRTVSAEELAFTGPMSVSIEDTVGIRARLIQLIEDLSPRIAASKPETLACLNIDFFRL